MSDIISRIDTAQQSANSSRDRAILLAKKGCYYSRIGRFDDVASIIIHLRERYGLGQDVLVSIWIILLEGLFNLYSEINTVAYDRIKRAQFLSSSIGDVDLIAITSSWRAHIDFEISDFDSMIQALRVAIKNAKLENHDAQSRLSLVFCDALYLCGDRDRAQFWFMRGRSHAVSSGDQATTDALLYNRAAFAMARLRAKACCAVVVVNEIEAVRREMTSARNFQDMTGIAAFSHLIGLCEARMSILEGSFEKAIDGLQVSRKEGPFASYNFDQVLIDLELTYCFIKINKMNEAKSLFDNLPNKDFSDLDLDEQLVVCWLRYQLSTVDPYFGDSNSLVESLNIIRTKYENHIYKLHTELVKLHEEVHLI
jgi:hypothetical protein